MIRHVPSERNNKEEETVILEEVMIEMVGILEEMIEEDNIWSGIGLDTVYNKMVMKESACVQTLTSAVCIL